MLSMEQAAELVLTLASREGFREVDAMLERDESLDVEIRNGKAEKIEQSTSLGLGIRVIREGRSGLASTERLDEEAIERAFRTACEHALLQDATGVYLPEVSPYTQDSQSLGLYQPELDRLTAGDLTEFGLEVEASARSADSRVTTLPYLGASRGRSETLLVNTRGVRYQHRSNSVSAYCGALLQEGERRKSGMHFWSQRVWEPQAARETGEQAVQKAAELLQAQPISSRKLPVVLDEYTAPRLLGMYFGAFSAESAQKGMSRLKGRLNEQIAVPELTLLDDPHRVNGTRSRFLDAEGVVTQPLPLVEDGVFRSFLYHVESGLQEDHASTGHAGRGYSGGISTRMHNLVWPTGSSSLQDLCATPEECLLVTQLEGAAGCNPVSGDISIGVQGFLMRNGERVQPVDSVTIAGNFFEVLKNIRGTGAVYQPNLSHLFIPALLVDGFAISG
jgi:PmbA protein